MDKTNQGKVVVATGATAGVGHAFVKEFASQGALARGRAFSRWSALTAVANWTALPLAVPDACYWSNGQSHA